MLKKGHIFKAAESCGYILTRDINVGDVFSPDCFEPFGGSPELRAGQLMPAWLANSIERASRGL